MALRDQLPKARVSNSHYFITLARGDTMRCLALRPWVLFTVAGLFPLFGILYFSASLVFIMRDDVVAAVFKRQQLMQQAYEDRIAEMRTQIDRVSSRQLLDQNSLESKMHDLLSRQARIETRATVVAELARAVGGQPVKASLPVPPPRPASLGKSGSGRRASLSAAPVDTDLPAGAISYATRSVAASPALQAMSGAIKDRPRPYALEVLSGPSDGAGTPVRPSGLADPYAQAIASDTKLPVELRLGAMIQSLDLLEIEQLRKVAAVGSAARVRSDRLRTVIASTGLSPSSLRMPATAVNQASGGPFVPYKFDPDGPPFERAVHQLQKYVLEAQRLRVLATHVPLRRPISAGAEVSSKFGRRIDPFNGRVAAHTGMDFRAPKGMPVVATASGVVVKASHQGGYGNMVEVDHGNGIASRYAHLSSISASVGQRVSPGTRLGRVGSTGRSTGPHLHYEVRLSDHPVNPLRFLRAGEKI